MAAQRAFGANQHSSPSAINSPNFGVAFAASASGGSGSRTASIDDITVTVYYTKQFYILGATTPTAPTFYKSLGENSVNSSFTAVVTATSTATGNYAYVGTASSTVPVEVIDVATTTPTVVSGFSVPSGDAGANVLFYKDGYLYLGTPKSAAGPEFKVIDVHNPLSLPASALGSYEVNAGVTSIYVKNGYAYLGTDDNTRELLVLDVNDLAHPALRGIYDAPGAINSGYGKSLYTVGDTLYFGRTWILNTSPEFAVLNTASATPALLGSFDTGPNSGSPFGVYGVIVGNGTVSGTPSWLALTLTGSQSNGGKFQVLNVNNPASVSSIASLTLPNSGSGIALDCEWNAATAKDYVYAASVPPSGSFANKGAISIITTP